MDDRVVIGYAPIKMLRWEDMRAQLSPSHVDFPLRAPVDQAGYIPVYTTLEALQAEWGANCQYMIIRQEPSLCC
jgi:hypothetical protein